MPIVTNMRPDLFPTLRSIRRNSQVSSRGEAQPLVTVRSPQQNEAQEIFSRDTDGANRCFILPNQCVVTIPPGGTQFIIKGEIAAGDNAAGAAAVGARASFVGAILGFVRQVYAQVMAFFSGSQATKHFAHDTDVGHCGVMPGAYVEDDADRNRVPRVGAEMVSSAVSAGPATVWATLCCVAVVLQLANLEPDWTELLTVGLVLATVSLAVCKPLFALRPPELSPVHAELPAALLEVKQEFTPRLTRLEGEFTRPIGISTSQDNPVWNVSLRGCEVDKEGLITPKGTAYYNGAKQLFAWLPLSLEIPSRAVKACAPKFYATLFPPFEMGIQQIINNSD